MRRIIDADKRAKWLGREMELLSPIRQRFIMGQLAICRLEETAAQSTKFAEDLTLVGKSQSGVTLMEVARDILDNPQTNPRTLETVLRTLKEYITPKKRCPVPILIAQLIYRVDDIIKQYDGSTQPETAIDLLGSFIQRVVIEEDTYVTSRWTNLIPSDAFKQQVTGAINSRNYPAMVQTVLNYLETGDHLNNSAFANEEEIQQAYELWCQLGEIYSMDPNLSRYLAKLEPVGQIFRGILADYYKEGSLLGRLPLQSLKTIKSFLVDPPLVRYTTSGV